MTITLTPAEEGAGAGAALGLVASLVLFKKPSLTETAVGTLIGAGVGYLGAQVWAAAMSAPSAANALPTPSSSTSGSGSSTSTDTSSSTTTDTSTNPNDAGGGGSSF